MTADNKKFQWTVPAICGGLAVITIIVFGQTLGFDFVNFDDNLYVYENARVAAGLGLKNVAWFFGHPDCSLYHPLTMLSLAADYQFHGPHPGWYHLTNVLLHTGSAVLLFLVLRQMTGALWRSAFVAALFAVHPLRVESVAWVSERKDVLSGFFFMLTLAAYVSYVRRPNSLARYLTVVVAFVMALLSKPTAVTLPFLLLLLDYWPLQRRETLRRLAAEKIPLAALAAGACWMTISAAGKAIATTAPIPMTARLGNALVSYAIYLRQMVWPEDLAAFYPQPQHGYSAWAIAGSALLLVLVTAAVLAVARQRRWLLTGWFWYLGMLLPMIGLVQAGDFSHADRMTYLPQIGICLAAVWLVAESGLGSAACGVLMAGVLALLMVCASQQTGIWQNSETMWTYTLAATTDNAYANDSLGLVLMQKGKLDGAVNYLRQAIQLSPGLAAAHDNLGYALLQLGNVDEAVAECRLATELKPDDAEAHGNLGNALSRQGQLDEAIAQFRAGLQIKPSQAMLHNNLGAVLLRKGNLDEAMAEFQQALQINPQLAEAQNNFVQGVKQKESRAGGTNRFSGFQDSLNFNERVASFTLDPEVKVQINAPPASDFGRGKKVMLILYALPNGNTTEQTIGRKLKPGDDWHFDIQHIGAQTRFLRQMLPDRNIVVAYLEANASTIPKSWPAWRKKNGDAPIPGIVAAIRQIFTDELADLVLSGHSGGGSFIFGYLNAAQNIPNDITRIAFLDSNYAYSPTNGHAEKLSKWLAASDEHRLCVLAYNDAAARLNGKPFVSAEGGTWGRSHAMIKDLGARFPLRAETNGTLEKISGLDGRIEFLLKENPERKVLHTVQVERNGFIESMLSGTTNQGRGYEYFGDRAYTNWVQ